MAKFATNASGAMLLPNLVQVMESISGSVVPLAMFIMWLYSRTKWQVLKSRNVNIAQKTGTELNHKAYERLAQYIPAF